MILDGVIDTTQLILRSLSAKQAGGRYLAWMNDPEVVRFTESRDRHFERADLESYILSCNSDPSTLLLGLFDKPDAAHSGNIKLGPIDWRDRRADIGLIIDKQKWGRRFGREAIAGLTRYAFSTLNLHKISAGCYASNRGSARAFLMVGWHEEAYRKRHSLFEKRWEDVILLACFRPDGQGISESYRC